MGQFAQLSDVQAEFEGVIPTSRQAFVTAKIGAVEARLIGLVPSLAQLTQSMDPNRFARAKYLVTEKVLMLYRNPAGVQSDSAMGQSATWNPAVSTGGITFTDDELATVRMRVKKANLGVARTMPMHLGGGPGALRGCW